MGVLQDSHSEHYHNDALLIQTFRNLCFDKYFVL